MKTRALVSPSIKIDGYSCTNRISCWDAYPALVTRVVVVVRQLLAALVEELRLNQPRNGEGDAGVGG